MDQRRSMLLALLITLFHVTRSNEERLLSRHVPLILWSPTSVFKAQNRYVAANLDDHGVVSVLKDLMRVSPEEESGALGPFSDNDSEILCLFLFPKLHTNELPLFRRIQTAKASVEVFVQHATSSVVAPYTTRAYSIKKMLDDDDTVVLSINDVGEFLGSDEAKALSSNNKKDLLLVEIPEDMSFVEADSLIKTTVAFITKITKERVDFGLTSDQAAEYNREGTEAHWQSRRLDQAAQLQCEVGYILGGSIDKPFCFSRYVHMTPEIMSGILIGFFFILLLYVGIGAMHSLQTPTRFPAHGPPKGKEF
uniref:Uncharacterized protein AlNc14C143G7330 n=1 Tax=Albugo laibachii Nc14 TaxID=890382 RepID=F0WLE2_9STRA|nr:conserved hypothetical protein [Albugo laibachii Nc14]|eukprot:CCA22105.1 conserved hypothetical protein [Albugo laibachii Nc14]